MHQQKFKQPSGGISDWNEILSLNPTEILVAPGCGKKAMALFEEWREYCLNSMSKQHNPKCAALCSKFNSFSEYLLAILKDVVPKLNEVRMAVIHYRLGLFDELEPLTLEETGRKAGGLTRQRIQMVESEIRKLFARNNDLFSDLVQHIEAVFDRHTYVMRSDDFIQCLTSDIPEWHNVNDAFSSIIRLLNILGIDVQTIPGKRLSDTQFIVINFERNGRARYDRFLDLLRTEALSNESVLYPAVRDRLLTSGVPNFTKTEYDCFVEKTLETKEKTEGIQRLRLLHGAANRSERIRAAILELLEPAGIHGLTGPELDSGLREKLGAYAPSIRSCLRLTNIDGRGTDIWISNLGGGNGNVSRYALSSFCPDIPEWLVKNLESELAMHLRTNGCDACLISRFADKWKQEGKVAADIPERFLLGSMKKGTAGIVIYPNCHGSPAIALPESGLSGKYTELFVREAKLFFSGRMTVPEDEMVAFAVNVFGYHDEWPASNECRRFFRRNNGCFILSYPNENLR